MLASLAPVPVHGEDEGSGGGRGLGGGSASDLVGPGSGKVQRLPRLEQDTGGVVVEGVFTRRRRVLADLGGAPVDAADLLRSALTILGPPTNREVRS